MIKIILAVFTIFVFSQAEPSLNTSSSSVANQLLDQLNLTVAAKREEALQLQNYLLSNMRMFANDELATQQQRMTAKVSELYNEMTPVTISGISKNPIICMESIPTAMYRLPRYISAIRGCIEVTVSHADHAFQNFDEVFKRVYQVIADLHNELVGCGENSACIDGVVVKLVSALTEQPDAITAMEDFWVKSIFSKIETLKTCDNTQIIADEGKSILDGLRQCIDAM